MRKICPSEGSMRALTAFQIYEGTGEWFDLSKKPIERVSFAFGGKAAKPEGYVISGDCTGCGKCGTVCPQNCILTDSIPAVIAQAHCLRCGRCMDVCPSGAVKKR